MSDLWHFFITHWLVIFWVWIGLAFGIMGIWIGAHELLFRIERRRYRRASKP